MITPHTVKQLLQVFHLFHANHTRGMPLNRSYHEAVRSVAEGSSVTYQTIGDGCRRRLELTSINELYEMLSAWVRSESRALLNQLKKCSDPAAHAEIERFFSMTEVTTPSKPKPSFESVAVSLRLQARDARLLRALAELEGEEVIARVVSGAVRERMKVVARGLIDEGPAHA